MGNKLFRLLLSMLLIGCLTLTACSGVNQKKILAQIIGTWSCQSNNIAHSGMSFHRNFNLNLYQTQNQNSKHKLDHTDYFAQGLYRVRKNILITKVHYKAPLIALSVDPDIKKKFNFPLEQVTHTYVVKKISSRSLEMVQKDNFLNRGKMICNKVEAPEPDYHFKAFLAQLELKKEKARVLFAKLQAIRKNFMTRKIIANNINLVRDAAYYRSILARLLPIASETIPQKLRLTSIVGQDLNYQFSGITDKDTVVDTFVKKLENHPELESVQVSANKSFNIISKRDNKKISQTLYEFQVSVSFKSSTHEKASAGKIPLKLNFSKEHTQKDLELSEMFDSESDKLVKNNDIPALLKHLNTTAAKSGVRFSIFQPNNDQIRAQKLVQLSVTISIKGKYKALASFLAKLSSYNKLVALSGVQIEPESYDSLSGNLVMSGYLTFYGTHPSGKTLAINRYTKLFPSTKAANSDRGLDFGSLAKIRDPFNSYVVKSKHIAGPKPKCANLAALPLSTLQYVGRVKQKQGFTALIKAPNNTIMRVTEGSCIANSVSVTKILRSKIMLRKNVRLKSGRWAPKTITLHATDK